MIKDEKLKKVNFTKIFWNYQKQESFRNESYTTEYKHWLIIATKVKNNLIRQTHQNYHSDRL
nr:hypothetical protein [Mycoplasmopsis bovis]